MSPIRVLVVDDSSFVRRAVSRMLAADPDIEVVAHAAHGAEAIERLAATAPDVVTLDLHMPKISGMETLRRIMSERPTPVVLLSSFAQSEAAITLEALSAGAVDFVDKASVSLMDVYALADELIRKIKAAARSRPRAPLRSNAPPPLERADAAADVGVIVVGASTGGPPAIQLLLSQLPRDFGVPLVVVQHMPAGFTRAFAQRLDGVCNLEVREAENGDPVVAGRALIAPGGRHFGVRRHAGGAEAVVTEGAKDGVHIPSIDVAALAASAVYGSATCLAVLTGMGADGTEGARAVRNSGGLVIAQSEATCVIYGMPRAVVREGLATCSLAIDEMAALFVRLAARSDRAARNERRERER